MRFQLIFVVSVRVAVDDWSVIKITFVEIHRILLSSDSWRAGLFSQVKKSFFPTDVFTERFYVFGAKRVILVRENLRRGSYLSLRGVATVHRLLKHFFIHFQII